MSSRNHKKPRPDIPMLRELHKERLQRGLSQQDLAIQIGCSMNALGDWERGDATPQLPFLFAWAKALGFKVTISKEMNDG
jgi:transcriptional regulator with XRE-family HTH domain